MSSPPALEVKYLSGKCQGCTRTLTEAVPLLRAAGCLHCLQSPDSGPPAAGVAGWEVAYQVAASSSENVKMWQRRSPGSPRTKITKTSAAAAACQASRSAAGSLSTRS